MSHMVPGGNRQRFVLLLTVESDRAGWHGPKLSPAELRDAVRRQVDRGEGLEVVQVAGFETVGGA